MISLLAFPCNGRYDDFMIYRPDSPYRFSRSKLEMFLACPRCFYLDRRLGIKRPFVPPYTLNMAVDALLKKEFDCYRDAIEPHPWMIANGTITVPFSFPASWREHSQGVERQHEGTNLIVHGAVDDVWVNSKGLMVVEYKATSTSREVTLDDEWKQSYKRQVEIHQWLIRGNGYSVSNTAYFVYANARQDRDGFGDRLEFDTKLIEYEGDDSWVDAAVTAAWECLESDLPDSNPKCEWCSYALTARLASPSG